MSRILLAYRIYPPTLRVFPSYYCKANVQILLIQEEQTFETWRPSRAADNFEKSLGQLPQYVPIDMPRDDWNYLEDTVMRVERHEGENALAVVSVSK